MNDILKGDHILWIVFITLCSISLIEVFSAASTLSYKSGDHLAPITAHCITLGIGAVCVYIFHLCPYKYFRLIPYFLLPLSWLLLLMVMAMGIFADERVNGASRWIFGFQPSEMAKGCLVVTVAYILSRYQTEKACSSLAFKPILLVTALTLLFIAPENGSTALLLAVVIYMMMIIGRIPGRQIGKLTVGVLLAGGLMVTLVMTVPPSVYQDVPGTHRFVTWRNRINEFINPEVVPASAYDVDRKAQKAHANIAIATSHVLGKGPGNSIQRDHLSHSYSDYIYAIVIEELGLLGGAFVVLLYIIIIFRVGYIAKRTDDNFACLLVIGLGLLLVTQAMMHMFVTVGLFPVTGQPLPLISKGGSSIFFNSIYIGIILSVSRTIEEQQSASLPDSSVPSDSRATDGTEQNGSGTAQPDMD